MRAAAKVGVDNKSVVLFGGSNGLEVALPRAEHRTVYGICWFQGKWTERQTSFRVDRQWSRWFAALLFEGLRSIADQSSI
jgi:hypothetical protein